MTNKRRRWLSRNIARNRLFYEAPALQEEHITHTMASQSNFVVNIRCTWPVAWWLSGTASDGKKLCRYCKVFISTKEIGRFFDHNYNSILQRE